MIQDTTKLEYVLSAYVRPTFLAITEPDEDNDIQVLVCCNLFNIMDIEDRIEYIFNVINEQCPEVVQDRLIIIQAYSSDEMEQVIENIFKNSDLL